MFDNLRTTRQDTDPNVGDRFVESVDRTYTENGSKGIHHTEVMYEVTALTHNGFDARGVEVIAESGRPSFAGKRYPADTSTVSMVWFGWDAAVKRGDVKSV